MENTECSPRKTNKLTVIQNCENNLKTHQPIITKKKRIYYPEELYRIGLLVNKN